MKQPEPLIKPADVHVTERWRFWKHDFSKSIIVLWTSSQVKLSRIKKGLYKQVGKNFKYERDTSTQPDPQWYATQEGLTRTKKTGQCPDCGMTMLRLTIKKGRWGGRGVMTEHKGKRAFYRFTCSCGHQHTEFGDGTREDAIARGHFDEQIGILHNPDEQ